MKKIMIYMIPIVLFIILTVLKEIFDLNVTLYGVFVLIIIMSIPFIKTMAKNQE
ncbi:hypothetical protein ACS127_15890 [Amphibacillus sp. Q70]|uniref:hypothetical protein n=1 Tax=Amphibacillus sp. Q70 TaxID=3453416 RepID=UPI003F864D61